MTDQNKSEQTLEDLMKKKFRIPLYQRSYAWQSEQVEQLLKDLDANSEGYYLGIITVAPTSEPNCFDLIDGQQRLTTLLLIAKWLDNNGHNSNTINWENIEFYGRPKDQEFIRADDPKNFEGCNQLLVSAYNVVDSFFAGFPEDVKKAKLSKFPASLNSAKVFLAEIPKEYSIAEKNHFFVRMNNRGKQLEKHEILKIQLISKLEEKEQEEFFKHWNEMERIFSGEIEPEKVEKQTDKSQEKSGENKTISLKEMIEKNDPEKSPAAKAALSIPVISIEEFLLIALARFFKSTLSETLEVSFSKEKFLEQFDKLDKDKIKPFLGVLFYQLKLLKKFIIFKNGEEHRLGLKNEKGAADVDKKPLIAVQAFLVASTEPHHWMIGAFDWLTKPEGEKVTDDFVDKFVVALETIDNRLCKEVPIKRTLKPAYDEVEKAIEKNDVSLFQYPNISHYWFYRLDYELWKLWQSPDHWQELRKEPIRTILSKFRFRKLGSVEHIEPQNEDGKNNQDPPKHGLENLALLSVSQNSKFNNYPSGVKKEKICKGEKTSESLKMVHRLWTNEGQHKTAITELLKNICDFVKNA